MSWTDFGYGPGVYRSGSLQADTIQLAAIPDILEDLRIGVNERIAITDLADVAAFETGEGLTYAEIKAAVTALRTKIEALIGTGYCLNSWAVPPSFFTTIADVLALGSYGNSWLTFERLQDGRVYEQIREALDVIVAVGVSVTKLPHNIAEVYSSYGGGGWLTWRGSVQAGIVEAMGPPPEPPGLLLTVSGTPGLRVPLATLCPSALIQGYMLYMADSVNTPDKLLPIITIDLQSHTHGDATHWYSGTGTHDDDYFYLNVSHNCASNPWTYYGGVSITYAAPLDDAVILFDRGSTWIKKP